MDDDSITHRVLIEIRDELRATNVRADKIASGMEKIDGRLAAVESGLESAEDRTATMHARLIGAEIRTTTAITDLHGTLRDAIDHMKRRDGLSERVGRVEHDVEDLKRRLG